MNAHRNRSEERARVRAQASRLSPRDDRNEGAEDFDADVGAPPPRPARRVTGSITVPDARSDELRPGRVPTDFPDAKDATHNDAVRASQDTRPPAERVAPTQPGPLTRTDINGQRETVPGGGFTGAEQADAEPDAAAWPDDALELQPAGRGGSARVGSGRPGRVESARASALGLGDASPAYVVSNFGITPEAHKAFGQARDKQETVTQATLRMVSQAVDELRARGDSGRMTIGGGVFPVVEGPKVRVRRNISRVEFRIRLHPTHRKVLGDLADELTGGNVSELLTQAFLVAGRKK